MMQVYDDFVGHVAAARKLSAQQVEGGWKREREGGGGSEREREREKERETMTGYTRVIEFILIQMKRESFSEQSLTEGAREHVSHTHTRTHTHTHTYTHAHTHAHTGGRSGKRSRMDGSAGIQSQARRWPFDCVLFVCNHFIVPL
jgi:hypothetical protein